MPPDNAPEERTVDVDVEALDTRGRTLHGYAAVYGAESGDLGGFRERIAPGAFSGVLDADVRCLLNHDPCQVLGRTKSGTMRLADELRGLRFECDLPDSPLGENVRAAVSRGDIDGASFRFKVGQEHWDGDMRTVRTVAELFDITVATYGAYPAASVELRTRPENTENTNGAERQEGGTMLPTENENGAVENTNDAEHTEDRTEDRTSQRPAGGLQVEDRAGGNEGGSLIRAFEAEGWPREPAAISWSEFRSASFTGTVDTLAPVRQDGVGLGQDVRYAFPAFGQVAVDADATAVQVLRQGARTLPAAADVVRGIDAVTAKPEVATVTEVVTVPLKQVAAIETEIPNVILDQPAIEPLVQTDLRLALNEGLDKLILDAVAASGFQAPGTDPLLISIRKAMTLIQADGYNPDTVVLTPANAEALDTLRATADAAEQFYVFPAAGLAPRSVYGLQVRISKTIPAPVVADAAALGKLYISPVELARFEADAGTTNRSNVRLEAHAAFGVERQDAAVRIAAA
ncbi:MAG: HK97 family phage prohead protease [Solirubrobacteraceae bacterium]